MTARTQAIAAWRAGCSKDGLGQDAGAVVVERHVDGELPISEGESVGNGHHEGAWVKSTGAQREADGVVVPPIGVDENAPKGKGPDFGRAGRGGTRQGMAGTVRPISPGGRPPVDQVLLPSRWPAAPTGARSSPGRASPGRHLPRSRVREARPAGARSSARAPDYTEWAAPAPIIGSPCRCHRAE
jgi:hypothetical protein